jgi:hypothetical protein
MGREGRAFGEIRRTLCMSETSMWDQVGWPVLLSKYIHNTSLDHNASGSHTHQHSVYALPAAV